MGHSRVLLDDSVWICATGFRRGVGIIGANFYSGFGTGGSGRLIFIVTVVARGQHKSGGNRQE
jgi:hypothetical protein